VTIEAAFLGSLSAGILTLVAGLTLIRLHWRPDTLPYGRHTHLLDVTFHPELYVKDAPLRAIRCLNMAGVFFLGAAVTLLAVELLRSIQRP
jgi:hypothetical protein